MISTSDFKNGQTIAFNDNIYQIVEFLHVKPGKGAAFVRTKLRNLRTGSLFDHTFSAGDKVEKAQIDKVPVQFLYQAGQTYVFMNLETYEQIEIQESQLEYKKNYLIETLEVNIVMYNESEILGINLPEKISLTIKETEPGVKGDTKTTAMKDAIMETGLLVKVPLFVENGEKIIVSTSDGSYVSRDNK